MVTIIDNIMHRNFLNLSVSFLLVGLVAISCNQKSTEEIRQGLDSIHVNEPTASFDTATISKNCYTAIKENDTIQFSIEDNLGTIIGEMSFKKDDQNVKASLIGQQTGDTLKFVYNSDLEKDISDKEVWFLKKDDKLLEAVGPYDASGQYYAQPKKLTFGKGNNFIENPCQ